MDRRRYVQQYVQRQRPYVPTYTSLNECPRTPAKPIQTDQFGFDTPVLRPRVQANKSSQSQLAPKVGPDHRDPSSSNKDKRKKTSSPVDSDIERAARLADRRERKRNKRAIVNPPQKHDKDSVPTAASKKKAKKPTALALLYGFSATNVTKDRLTVKSAPSLGVFSKGKASVKKKVTAIKKAGASKNEIFSEFAFLNKSNELAADHSKVDDGSDDNSVSLTSKHPTRRTQKDQTALKIPQASTAESEVWDIELQSKLPSTAPGISSEPRANDSASVVLNLCGAEWSATLQVAGKHEECHNNRSMGPPMVRSSSLARSDLRDEFDVARAADEAPSIHPSQSASQVGRRVADTQSLVADLRQVRSKYFTHPEPAAVQPFFAELLQGSRSNDSLDVLNYRIPDQDVQDAAMDVQRILRVASPTDSLVSAGQPLGEFRSQYDVAPLEFPSDCFPYDDWHARADGATECLGDHGYCVEMQGDRSIASHDPHGDVDSFSFVVETPGVEYQQGCRFQCCASASDDVSYDLVQGYDALAPEYENGLEGRIAADSEEQSCVYTGEDDDCLNGELPEFLEGRALLHGAPQWPRLSGLAQAEMDVARRLQDHWRPMRLS